MTASRPKILVATFGSLGDLHPFVALAHALAAQGFAPVIATSAAYADYIRGEGLDFAAVRPDADDLTTRLGMDMAEIARRMSTDDAFLFQTLIFPHLRETYDDLLAASEGAVAIVGHSLAFAGRLVAEKRQLPLFTVLLSPLMLYSAYDPPMGSNAPLLTPPKGGLAVAYNKTTLWLLAQAMGLWAKPLRRLRREVGLPRRSGLDLLLGAKSSTATIGLFSPTLAPPQPDHAPGLLIAGHTFHDRFLDGAALPPELEAFLAQGAPPVVFTLGSFVARAGLETYRACLDVAGRLGRRAVVLAHEEIAPQLRAEAHATAHVAAYAPHSAIFPRACAIVHHGGIGTTGQALRAGRPQIVLPHLGDQYDNGARLQRLGVAQVIKGAQMTRDNLARDLAAILDDADCARHAERLGQQLAQEDGARTAAAHIAKLIEQEKRA